MGLNGRVDWFEITKPTKKEIIFGKPVVSPNLEMNSMQDLQSDPENLAKKYETNPNFELNDENLIVNNEKPKSDKNIQHNFIKNKESKGTKK